MIIDRIENVAAGPAKEQDARGVQMQVLISDKQGAPNFIMRVFEIEPGGHTPHHSHPWEHEVYVLEGAGAVRQRGKDSPIQRGSYALVLPDEQHQFVNLGDTPLKFICVIPITSRRQ
jgi:quercetin dioxygenase-like cupin family protein